MRQSVIKYIRQSFEESRIETEYWQIELEISTL